MSMFSKATKTKAKLRLALAGPAGSGKTYTALALATVIADGGRVAVIDTENGSASKYADLFSFDAADLTVRSGFSPERYLDLLHGAESEGYDVIVIDSLSHEWAGQDGILQAVDAAAAKVSGNKFVAWGQVTPRHDKLVRAIVESPAHVICTLRAKMEYVQERNDRGRTEIRAVGMKPIQRDELEYEFDVYGLLDQDNRLVVRKSRCPQLSGAVIDKPGKDVAGLLVDWLDTGVRAEPAVFAPAEAPNPVPRPSAPTTSPVAPTPAQLGEAVGPTPLHDAEKAAILTGANPPHQPGGYFCVECHGLVTSDGEVSVPRLRQDGTLARKPDGTLAKVSVSVLAFAPVCEERLGGFHCPGCYEQKMSGAA